MSLRVHLSTVHLCNTLSPFPSTISYPDLHQFLSKQRFSRTRIPLLSFGSLKPVRFRCLFLKHNPQILEKHFRRLVRDVLIALRSRTSSFAPPPHEHNHRYCLQWIEAMHVYLPTQPGKFWLFSRVGPRARPEQLGELKSDRLNRALNVY